MSAKVYLQFNRIRRLEIELELTQACDALITDLEIALNDFRCFDVSKLENEVMKSELKLQNHIKTCAIPDNSQLSKDHPRFEAASKETGTNHCLHAVG